MYAKISFFLWLNSVPLCVRTHARACVCVCVCTHHIFFIYSCITGPWEWPWECWCIFEILILILLVKYPKVVLLDQMVVLFLIFWSTSILFSIAAASFCISTKSVHMVQFLHILVNVIFTIFCSCCPKRFELIPHCGFAFVDLQMWICIFLLISDVEQVFIYFWALCNVFFGELSVEALCPFFNKGFCFVGVFCLFLLLSCRSYLDILDTNLLSYIWFANIFLFFRFLFCPATAF